MGLPRQYGNLLQVVKARTRNEPVPVLDDNLNNVDAKLFGTNPPEQ